MAVDYWLNQLVKSTSSGSGVAIHANNGYLGKTFAKVSSKRSVPCPTANRLCPAHSGQIDTGLPMIAVMTPQGVGLAMEVGFASQYLQPGIHPQSVHMRMGEYPRRLKNECLLAVVDGMSYSSLGCFAHAIFGLSYLTSIKRMVG